MPHTISVLAAAALATAAPSSSWQAIHQPKPPLEVRQLQGWVTPEGRVFATGFVLCNFPASDPARRPAGFSFLDRLNVSQAPGVRESEELRSPIDLEKFPCDRAFRTRTVGPAVFTADKATVSIWLDECGAWKGNFEICYQWRGGSGNRLRRA